MLGSWSRSKRAEMTACVSPTQRRLLAITLVQRPGVPPTTPHKSESTTHLVQDPGNGP